MISSRLDFSAWKAMGNLAISLHSLIIWGSDASPVPAARRRYPSKERIYADRQILRYLFGSPFISASRTPTNLPSTYAQ